MLVEQPCWRWGPQDRWSVVSERRLQRWRASIGRLAGGSGGGSRQKAGKKQQQAGSTSSKQRLTKLLPRVLDLLRNQIQECLAVLDLQGMTGTVIATMPPAWPAATSVVTCTLRTTPGVRCQPQPAARTSSSDLAFSRPMDVPSPPLSFSTAVWRSRSCTREI